MKQQSPPVEGAASGIGAGKWRAREAALALSAHFGVWLAPGRVPGIDLAFDLVSFDGRVVGDVLATCLDAGAEADALAAVTVRVWVLERTGAPRPFLVFADRRLPLRWLEVYGSLLRRWPSPVWLFFLDDDGALEVVAAPSAEEVRAREDAARPVAHENPYLAFAGRFKDDPFRDEVDAYIREQRERDREEREREAGDA